MLKLSLIVLLGILLAGCKNQEEESLDDKAEPNLAQIDSDEQIEADLTQKDTDEQKDIIENSLQYTSENLKLRTGPGLDFEIITTMPIGSEVEFLESLDDWNKISFNGQEGYASARYLTSTPYPKTPTTIGEIILVNKQHPLPLNYAPGENKEAKSALTQMLSAYEQETGKKLTAFSGYRTFEYQKGLFERYAASDGYENALTYSAKPRFSEHETGLAFDIGGEDQSMWLQEDFEQTEEGIWLRENAATYGFILRYPKDKTGITGYIYEPWHFRYVGAQHAKKIYQNDITLEEYLLE